MHQLVQSAEKGLKEAGVEVKLFQVLVPFWCSMFAAYLISV